MPGLAAGPEIFENLEIVLLCSMGVCLPDEILLLLVMYFPVLVIKLFILGVTPSEFMFDRDEETGCLFL